ncbi:hypothetical protein NEDG_01857 [Nematocida displodere]|uniref:Uncharacterized protein n=1 Tax=Nematocida displodere TaxID=1805483 RepID=A0A177EGJ8_9MICR|nr:hypothetical protein NEDG_01857 [Nematocida displodere]
MEIERAIEAINDGDSSISAERLVFDRLEEVIKYIGFIEYKEGPKARKMATIETLKTALVEKSLAKRLCSENYLFLLKAIRHNGYAKKVPEAIIELSYEAYAESLKALLEFNSQDTITTITSSNECYLDLVLKCSDSHHIIDLFPCFFSLSEEPFLKWITFLISKNFVGSIIKNMNKYKKALKETQNFSKLLYLLVSFTGSLFKRQLRLEAGTEYMHFYNEIENRSDTLLDTVFIETDAINRVAALETIRELIKTTEFLPPRSEAFSFLFIYVAGSEILKRIKENHHSADTTIKTVILINTIARTIRFKSAALKAFFSATDFPTALIRYAYSTSTHTLTNEVCIFLNELVHTDTAFYLDALVEICKEIHSCSLKQVIQAYASSQKKHAPSAALVDFTTPFVYLIYQLYDICLDVAAAEPTGTTSTLARFTVIDKGVDVYQIIQELSFLSQDLYIWYRFSRIQEHKKRLSLAYATEPIEIYSATEQFARYLCHCTAAVLPDYPASLLL